MNGSLGILATQVTLSAVAENEKKMLLRQAQNEMVREKVHSKEWTISTNDILRARHLVSMKTVLGCVRCHIRCSNLIVPLAI